MHQILTPIIIPYLFSSSCYCSRKRKFNFSPASANSDTQNYRRSFNEKCHILQFTFSFWNSIITIYKKTLLTTFFNLIVQIYNSNNLLVPFHYHINIGLLFTVKILSSYRLDRLITVTDTLKLTIHGSAP